MTRNKRLMLASIVGAVVAVVVTIIVMNFTTSESEIERSLEHRYGVSDPQFRRELGILLGPPIIDGNRVQGLQNGVEIFPAMLEAIRGARADDYVRDVHLLVRRGRPGICGRLVRKGARRRQGARVDRLGRQPEDGRCAARGDGDCGSRGAPVSPAALVQPDAHEQPYASQVARRRREGRLHGRRGYQR